MAVKRRRVLALTLGCVILPCGILAFVLLASEAAWIGRFPLTITIENTQNAPIRSIELDAFARREHAEAFKAGNRVERGLNHMVVDPVQADPIEFIVTTSGRHSMLLGERAYFQPEHLVVIARWADGSETAKYVAIPDGRKTQKLIVQLP